MYIPASFRIDDAEKLIRLMREHSFATLVTHDGSAPFATHLPVLYHEGGDWPGKLVAHVARANPQWRHFQPEQEVLVMFQGPHAYISPSWYEAELAVPTWNYAAVHAYGIPALIEDHDRLVALLDELVAAYESSRPQPWGRELTAEFRDKLLPSIVGFEIRLTRVEGKFKLSQNRPAADIPGVHAALTDAGDENSLAIAAMMFDAGLVVQPTSP